MDLKGRLVAGPALDQFRTVLEQALARGHTKLLLNLQNVSFIDSAGLSVMVNGYVRNANTGGAIKLLNVPDRITSLMRITNLHTVFQTFTDEGQAVSSFN